jgi:hypothetical protein
VPRALRFAGFGWLLALGACRSMVGIEEAEVDPALGQAEVDPAPLGDGGSAGTGGGSTTAGGSGGTVNLEPVLSTCERYCNTVTQTCSGQFAQYATQTDCLAVCLLLPEGQVGETEHNSVQCRLTAAGQAPLEPSHYCPIAGPGGNGVCGSNCESLCTLVESLCAAEADAEELTGCKKNCQELSDLETYSVDPEAALYEGSHVQCRLYHATVAAVTDTEQHCQHALGGSPCD